MPTPSKLTDETRDVILRLIGAGNYRETAAEFAGIGRATLYRWLKRGEVAAAADEPDPADATYRDFYQAVVAAERQVEVLSLAKVRAAADQHWQAAAWWLERRFPERWGQRQKIDMPAFVEQRAGEIAAEFGIDKQELIAEVERIMRTRAPR